MIKINMGHFDNRQALYSAFAEKARAGENCLFLVPEQFTVHAENELLHLCGAGMGENAEVVSFKRLCIRILFAAGYGRQRNLDNAGRAVTMYRALQTARPYLEMYGKASPTASFIERLQDLDAELSRCSVTPLLIEEASVKIDSPSRSKKLRELAVILDTYNALLESSGEEIRTDLEIAASLLRDTDIFSGYKIFVDGFYLFSEQEYMLLHNLAGRCDITVALMCDAMNDTEGGYGLFSDVKATARRFMRIAEKTKVALQTEIFEDDGYHKSKELKFLKEHLFGYTAIFEQKTKDISCYIAADAFAEAQAVAAKIKELNRQGYLYGDIAVLFRQADQYKGIVDSVFMLHDIPVFTDKRTEIMIKPLVLFVRTALEIVSGKYYTEDIFSHIKTGLCDLTDEQVGELSRYCEIWDIPPAAWFKSSFTHNPEGFMESFDEKAKTRLKEINRCKQIVIEPLRKLKESLRGKTGKMCAALYEFLISCKIPEKLVNEANKLACEGQAALSQETAQTWEIFVKALDQLSVAAQDDECTCEEFSQMLMCALSAYDIGRIPTSVDEVLIGSVDRVKTYQKRAVFVMGINDGTFPLNIPDNGLIIDADRQSLAYVGIELEPGADERIFKERFFAYYAFTMPSEKLFLSARRMSGDGKEESLSYFLLHIKELFCGLEFDYEADLLQDKAFAFGRLIEGGLSDKALESYFEELPEYAPKLDSARRLQTFGKSDIATDRALTQTIKNSGLNISPTRMESFFKCRFAHFCKYILGIRAEGKADIDAPNTGIFIHHALEKILGEVALAGEGDLWDIPQQRLFDMVEALAKEYLEGYLGGSEDKSARFNYLFSRLSNILKTLVLSLCEEFRQSAFRTADFELKIGDDGEIPSLDIAFEGGSVRIAGVADRVDVLEKNGQTYVRIVDYKTGIKKFDMEDVYNGINTQMLLYLFSICENAAGRYGDRPHPAGVLYYPADDFIVLVSRSASAEEIEKEQRKKRLQSGLLIRNIEVLEGMESGLGGAFIRPRLNQKGEITPKKTVTTEKGFESIKKHIDKLLKQLGQEIISGNVTANPFKMSKQNSCRYCDYSAVCGYEPDRIRGREYEPYALSELKSDVEEAGSDDGFTDI